jgi:hypothetical protein
MSTRICFQYIQPYISVVTSAIRFQSQIHCNVKRGDMLKCRVDRAERGKGKRKIAVATLYR